VASDFEFNCRRDMLAQILCLMDEWENTVPLNVNPFRLKGRTLSCSGHLN
jgi:hypothetical protein